MTAERPAGQQRRKGVLGVLKQVPGVAWKGLVVLGTIGGLLVFLPRLVVDLGPPPETGDPFPANFKVTNASPFSLYDLTLIECKLNVLRLDHYTVLAGIFTLDSHQPNLRRLHRDESTYATCTFPAVLPPDRYHLYADISVIVSYRPILPFMMKQEKLARFVGKWHSDGAWVWEPLPLEGPDAGDGPDDASLLPPPTKLAGPTLDEARRLNSQEVTTPPPSPPVSNP